MAASKAPPPKMIRLVGGGDGVAFLRTGDQDAVQIGVTDGTKIVNAVVQNTEVAAGGLTTMNAISRAIDAALVELQS